MRIPAPLVSAASFGFIAVNLMFWSIPLLAVALARAALPRSAHRLRPALNGIYRKAVGGHHWWLTSVLGYQWSLPDLPLGRDTACIVIANHRNWADIFLLQSAISRTGPILTVLVKKGLVLVPPLGLVFWAYDFPVLSRKAARAEDEPARKGTDRQRIMDACSVVRAAPSGVLAFVEGTRFSASKRNAHGGAFDHLLPPRPAGFAAMCEGLADVAPIVVDATLIYPERATFWRFLSGRLDGIEFEATVHALPTRPVEWLNARWVAKDARIAQVSDLKEDANDSSG